MSLSMRASWRSLVLLVLASSVASTALGLAAQAAPEAVPRFPTALLLAGAIGAPCVGGGISLLFGPGMALGAGAVLVALGCLSVSVLHGLELAAVLGLLGHGILLAVAVGCLPAQLGRSGRPDAGTALVALWAGHLLASRLTEASPWAERPGLWLLSAALTLAATAIALTALKAGASAPRLDPPWTASARRAALAGAAVFPVALGAELRPATELGRLAPAAATRELALHGTAEIVALFLVLAVLLAWRSSRASRVVGAALLVYGASMGLSPALLGVRSGAWLAPLQLVGNLAEGAGALVFPLGLSWVLGAYSTRTAGFAAGIFLSMVGIGHVAGRLFLERALLLGGHGPRAAVLFLALLASTVAFAEGIALWARDDRSLP